MHMWNDNGSHLSCLEHSTYLHVDVMSTFLNLRLLTENRHCAKHGKDLADATVSLAKSAVAVLEKEIQGFKNPKSDMSRLQQVVLSRAFASEIQSKKIASLSLFWVDAAQQPRKFKTLKFDTVGSSLCRKSYHFSKGSEVFLSEHVRFDVPVGVRIPLTLVPRTRQPHPPHLTQLVDDLDAGVCSPRIQLNRSTKRISLIRSISKQLNINLDHVLNGSGTY